MCISKYCKNAIKMCCIISPTPTLHRVSHAQLWGSDLIIMFCKLHCCLFFLIINRINSICYIHCLANRTTSSFDYGTHSLWHCCHKLLQCHVYFCPQLHSFFSLCAGQSMCENDVSCFLNHSFTI